MIESKRISSCCRRALAFTALAALVLAGSGCARSGPAVDHGSGNVPSSHAGPVVKADCGIPSSATTVVPSRDLTRSEAELGIQVLSLRPTGAGKMMDLRYTVRDPVKARAMLARNASLTLIDESTGVIARVPTTPKVGSLRQKTAAPEEGRGYFALFFNPGNVFKPGRKVTLAAGDVRVKGLVVTE